MPPPKFGGLGGMGCQGESCLCAQAGAVSRDDRGEDRRQPRALREPEQGWANLPQMFAASHTSAAKVNTMGPQKQGASDSPPP